MLKTSLTAFAILLQLSTVTAQFDDSPLGERPLDIGDPASLVVNLVNLLSPGLDVSDPGDVFLFFAIYAALCLALYPFLRQTFGKIESSFDEGYSNADENKRVFRLAFGMTLVMAYISTYSVGSIVGFTLPILAGVLVFVGFFLSLGKVAFEFVSSDSDDGDEGFFTGLPQFISAPINFAGNLIGILFGWLPNVGDGQNGDPGTSGGSSSDAVESAQEATQRAAEETEELRQAVNRLSDDISEGQVQQKETEALNAIELAEEEIRSELSDCRDNIETTLIEVKKVQEKEKEIDEYLRNIKKTLESYDPSEDQLTTVRNSVAEQARKIMRIEKKEVGELEDTLERANSARKELEDVNDNIENVLEELLKIENLDTEEYESQTESELIAQTTQRINSLKRAYREELGELESGLSEEIDDESEYIQDIHDHLNKDEAVYNTLVEGNQVGADKDAADLFGEIQDRRKQIIELLNGLKEILEQIDNLPNGSA